MDEPRDLFWDDLEPNEVHIRDKWQFTLKSEFSPYSRANSNTYMQEFYLFIPSSLQIDKNTYSKIDFYLDESNFIRYKTPEFTLEQLLDQKDTRSPLYRILALCQKEEGLDDRSHLSDELKLLANVVRSSLRKAVKFILFTLELNKENATPEAITLTLQLCKDLEHLKTRYNEAEENYQKNWKDPLFYRELAYIEEFMNNSIAYYLTGLLDSIRLTGDKSYEQADDAIARLLLEKQPYEKMETSTEQRENESVLYRYGLLNKFVLNALTLSTNRLSLDERYQHWIGGISAGFAMLVYFSLFFWLGNVFVINSFPFLLLMIIAYVLKDRIKEWLKSYSYLKASRWFPDYITSVQSYDGKKNLGHIEESFSFINPSQLSEELKKLRNIGFHNILEAVVRPESIIFYKRIVKINASASESRRHGLNVIFRYNIHRFLNKAADPSEIHLVLDENTKKILSVRLPKVYHLNLIIKTTSIKLDKTSKVELKKFRLIVDKNGIKRIEQVKKHSAPD